MLIMYLPIINVIITQNKQCQYFWQALIMFKEYFFVSVFALDMQRNIGVKFCHSTTMQMILITTEEIGSIKL